MAHWKRYRERGACSRHAFNRDTSVMPFHDLLHQCQSDASAREFGAVQADECVKNLVEVLGFHTDTIVGNNNLALIVLIRLDKYLNG